MSKMYFVFSLIVCFLVGSLHSSDFDLQRKTVECLNDRSLEDAENIIHEIQAVQSRIHQESELVDVSLQAVGFNYTQWQQYAQRFITLPQEALIQDEASAYNPSLFTHESKIFYEALKAKRAAELHNQPDGKILAEQQLRARFEAYIQQNLSTAGSQQYLLLEANRNLVFQKYLLSNQWITLNSWKDTLELHKQKILECDLLKSQQLLAATVEVDTIVRSGAVSDCEMVKSLDLKPLVAELETESAVNIAIKASTQETKKEAKQKRREAEEKRLQAKQQAQEHKQLAEEAEIKRRELQRQQDLERKAAQQVIVSKVTSNQDGKNKTGGSQAAKQKIKDLDKKMAQQKAIESRVKAEEEENRLLEEAQNEILKIKSQQKAACDDFNQRVMISSKKIKKDVTLSEENLKSFKRYLNFINFPSISALTEDLLSKVSGGIGVFVIDVHHLIDDLHKEKIDFKSDLLIKDPGYFDKAAQIRLNWVHALYAFVCESVDNTIRYDSLSFNMRVAMKKNETGTPILNLQELKDCKKQLDSVNKKIQSIHQIIGAIDSLQDKDRILSSPEENKIDVMTLALQDRIEKIINCNELPLTLQDTYEEIHYPTLIAHVTHHIAETFSKSAEEEHVEMARMIIQGAYSLFEKNKFTSYKHYAEFKAHNAQELENNVRSVYDSKSGNASAGQDDISVLLTMQNTIIDKLIMLALAERYNKTLSEFAHKS